VEACKPGTRGPGLVTGGGLPITFNKEACLVVHGNREWKILRLADGKQVWNWECAGPMDSPAWASGGPRPVGTNLYVDDLNGWQKSLATTSKRPAHLEEGSSGSVEPFVPINSAMCPYMLGSSDVFHTG
jgi:hypothetical protein